MKCPKCGEIFDAGKVRKAEVEPSPAELVFLTVVLLTFLGVTSQSLPQIDSTQLRRPDLTGTDRAFSFWTDSTRFLELNFSR
jgi:hypothetical protein